MLNGKALEEKILYENDFPVNIRLLSIENYPLHYHLDMEIIYVLRGSVTLKNGSSVYSIGVGSIFVSNKNEVHGIYDTSADNLVAVFQLQSSVMERCFPELVIRGGACFRTLGQDHKNSTYVHLQKSLIPCLYLWIKKSFGYKKAITTIMEGLLPYLDSNFNYWTYNENNELYWEDKSTPEKERLKNVIRYVYRHYDEKLTLEDLSYEMGLDLYYLSHLVKKDLGITFRELVLFARVELADRLLLGTNMSISDIRKRVAISTTDYFEKHFIRWYHCSSEEYRKKYQKHTILHAVAKLKSGNIDEILRIVEQMAEELSVVLPKGLVTSESIYISPATATSLTFCFRSQIWANGEWLTLREIDSFRYRMRSSKAALTEYEPSNYFWDTVLAPIYIVTSNFEGKTKCNKINYFRDTRGKCGTLQGKKGLFTSDGIVKPVYFAYKLLEEMSGDKLIYADSRSFATISPDKEKFSVLLANYNEAFLCFLAAEALFWKEVAEKLDSYQQKREVLLKVDNLLPGEYYLHWLSMSHQGSLFSYLSQNGLFEKDLSLPEEELAFYFAAPEMKVKKIAINGPYEQEIHLDDTSFCMLQFVKKQNDCEASHINSPESV
jgi:AraC-like DNA-binding protein